MFDFLWAETKTKIKRKTIKLNIKIDGLKGIDITFFYLNAFKRKMGKNVNKQRK
jgi:hypothetical protein